MSRLGLPGHFNLAVNCKYRVNTKTAMGPLHTSLTAGLLEILIINRHYFSAFRQRNSFLLQNSLQLSPPVNEEDMNDDNQTKTGFYLGRLPSTCATSPALSFLPFLSPHI